MTLSARGEQTALSWSNVVALEVNGEAISLPELLRTAQFKGHLAFLQSIADATLIRQAAGEKGLEVTDEELQKAANEFRASHELHKAADLRQWFGDKHLSIVAWESLLESEILVRKLRASLTDGKVEMYFAQNMLDFDSAAISRIIVSNEGIAKELRSQIAEEDADFHALAREYSQEAATKAAGGYAGIVRRSDLASTLEAAIFGAAPGAVVGPHKIDGGWALVRVEARQPAQLDEATRENIVERMFSEWLGDRRKKARIKVPLLELLIEEEE